MRSEPPPKKSRARGARRARALSLGARLRERTIYFSARLKVSFSFAAALVSFSLAAAALAVAISSSFLRFLSTLSGTSGAPFFAGAALAFAALAGIVGSFDLAICSPSFTGGGWPDSQFAGIFWSAPRWL